LGLLASSSSSLKEAEDFRIGDIMIDCSRLRNELRFYGNLRPTPLNLERIHRQQSIITHHAEEPKETDRSRVT
jgi:hypothetical protein